MLFLQVQRFILAKKVFWGYVHFKDSECWSGRGLNPRPPARLSGTLPTEESLCDLIYSSEEFLIILSATKHISSRYKCYTRPCLTAAKILYDDVIAIFCAVMETLY